MAIIPVQRLDKDGSNVKVFLWETMAKGDTGAPINIADFNDITLYVFGTFDSETIALHGSPEIEVATPTLYTALSDVGATLISVSEAGAVVVGAKAVWYKPVGSNTAATASDLDVYLVAV